MASHSQGEDQTDTTTCTTSPTGATQTTQQEQRKLHLIWTMCLCGQLQQHRTDNRYHKMPIF